MVSICVSDMTGISGILGMRGGGEGKDSDLILTAGSLCMNSVLGAG